MKNNFFILTGGPGSGKTSLINQLADMGYVCIPEVGRKIIKEQIINGGNALPWGDTKKYSELMLIKSIQDYTTFQNSENLCFFDRGIPDVLGYINLVKITQKQKYMDVVKKYRYNSTVYILPPWKEIYQNDKERKQDFKEAVATYSMMKEVYTAAGYLLQEIPHGTVEERTSYLLADLANKAI